MGFQPLLSLKGDAQAFKNAVCVRNLSGALVLATCFGNSVAKDGSAFSLPFKRKRQRKGEKILPRGWGVVAASKLLLLPDIDRG